MKRLHRPTWEQLDAIPEGEWVYLCHGMDVEFSYPPPRKKAARVVVPITAKAAAALSPWPGEVLEAHLKGRTVELVRRASRPTKRARSARHTKRTAGTRRAPRPTRP